MGDADQVVECREEILQAAIRNDSPTKLWPVVFSSDYDLRHWLTWFHPFDTKKWGRTFAILKRKLEGFTQDQVYEPTEICDDELLRIHSERYLDSLVSPLTVARVTEVLPVACLFKSTVKEKLLRPLRFQTAGTVMAARVAMERGCAINLGGGFHHCSSDRGMGFCAFADISLAIVSLLDSGLTRAMIIDLDAHQGNGHERDFLVDDRVYILDVYNRDIFPGDSYAKKGISRCIELTSGTRDETYLKKVRRHVTQALAEFQPEVVLYNAGTDILINDSLGCLSISSAGVIERDEIVFRACRRPDTSLAPIPLIMVTSGGYQRSNAAVIANSIENLYNKNLL